MDGKFTIEEGNLIGIYVGSTPDIKTAVDGISGVLQYIDDADMLDLAKRTIDKISRMTDEEFRAEYMEPVRG